MNQPQQRSRLGRTSTILDLIGLVAAVIAFVCGVSDKGGNAMEISLVVLITTIVLSRLLKLMTERQEAQRRPAS